MARILYHWKVAPEHLEEFIATWKKTTNKIHEEVKGAQGSFMIKNADDPTDIRTVAKWDALDDWRQFWHQNNHEQMGGMHALGKRVLVEVFDEVDDFTR